jgi:hypothetical protein
LGINWRMPAELRQDGKDTHPDITAGTI